MSNHTTTEEHASRIAELEGQVTTLIAQVHSLATALTKEAGFRRATMKVANDALNKANTIDRGLELLAQELATKADAEYTKRSLIALGTQITEAENHIDYRR